MAKNRGLFPNNVSIVFPKLLSHQVDGTNNTNNNTSMNERVDLEYLRYQQTMNKIARFAYKWINKEDASRGFVRKPDGLH